MSGSPGAGAGACAGARRWSIAERKARPLVLVQYWCWCVVFGTGDSVSKNSTRNECVVCSNFTLRRLPGWCSKYLKKVPALVCGDLRRKRERSARECLSVHAVLQWLRGCWNALCVCHAAHLVCASSEKPRLPGCCAMC